MQIVIDIPEDVLKRTVFYREFRDLNDCITTIKALENATPLPKGHGRLKDFEKIYADITEKEELARQRVIDTPTNSPCYLRYVAQLNERTAFKEMLYDAPTIIDADKESD